jgi:hypothetical protein
VSVYGGLDQLTVKEIRLRETVANRDTRRETQREVVKVQDRLLNKVDEQRRSRTEATVNDVPAKPAPATTEQRRSTSGNSQLTLLDRLSPRGIGS